MKAKHIITDLFEDTADDIAQVFSIDNLDNNKRNELNKIIDNTKDKAKEDAVDNYKKEQEQSAKSNNRPNVRKIKLSDVGNVRKSNFKLERNETDEQMLRNQHKANVNSKEHEERLEYYDDKVKRQQAEVEHQMRKKTSDRTR
ncbi:hypothetical protein [Vibrio harveyi]|uniref:hypothetical protein n=1 Tax=Vibrio harveyi TaxID=669 RepID=UPI0012637130|nr:hypothetical protein [Vibrio harveyi]QFQ76878.1 hypothetical protein F9277_05120 [Vibrio harveyi]